MTRKEPSPINGTRISENFREIRSLNPEKKPASWIGEKVSGFVFTSAQIRANSRLNLVLRLAGGES